MAEKTPLAERHTFIPTVHVHTWASATHTPLPPEATSLWLERTKFVNEELTKHPDHQVMSFDHPQCSRQIEEASRRDIPIYVGDANTSLWRSNAEHALTTTEIAAGAASLAALSSRVRRMFHQCCNRIKRNSPEESGDNAARSLSMSRRTLLAAVGSYLAFPALERAAQFVAPESEATSVMRNVNRTIHPEDCKYLIHVRNTIHALMLECTDRFFRDAHPCSMFGAFHSGIRDELGKTEEQKIDYLRSVNLQELDEPTIWQIQGFRYSERLQRFTNAETLTVPSLRKLLNSLPASS